MNVAERGSTFTLRMRLALLVAATIGAALPWLSDPPVYAIISGGVALTAILVFAGPQLTIRPLSFGTITIFYMLFVGCVQPLYRMLTNEYQFFHWDVAPRLAAASQLTIIGLAAFSLGYSLPLARKALASGGDVPARTHLAVTTVVVGVLMYILYLATSRSSLITGLKLVTGERTILGSGPRVDYLYLGLEVAMVGCVIGIVRYLRVGRRVLSGVLSLLAMIVFALFGFRFRLMIIAIAVTYASALYGVRVRLRHFVAGLLIAGFAFTFIGLYRAPREFRERADIRDVALTSFDLAAPLAVVATAVPAEHPYLWGSSYTPVITQWIPRSVWPDKPTSGTVRLLDELTAPGAGAAIPLWGEFYVNFGNGGVLVGMAIVGCCARRLDRARQALDRDNEFGVAMMGVGLGFWVHVLSRGNVTSQISVGAILFGVPLMLRWALMRSRSRVGRHRGSDAVGSSLGLSSIGVEENSTSRPWRL